MSNQGKYFLIDEKSQRPMEHAFVILNHAKGSKLAFAFAEFISSQAAKLIFEKYGFVLPK